MTATFACRDIGMECGFTAEAQSKEDLLPKIAEHAKSAHGMDTIPDDIFAKVNSAIKE